MHYTYKSMRDFANRLSRELDLKLRVYQSGSKKSRRYYLSEWNDIYGYGWIDINLGVYDKEQEEINMSREILGGGDWHKLSDCAEEIQTMVKNARRRGYPLVWIEMAIRTQRHKCHERRCVIAPHNVLSEAWAFDAIKEWLDERRAKRVDEDKPYLVETLKLLNRMRCDYVDYEEEYGEVIIIGVGDKCGLINLHGKPICEAKYDKLCIESPDYIQVEINDKYGYINSQGAEVIPVKFDHIHQFDNDGYAEAKYAGKYGVIDKNGNFVAEPKYDEIRIENYAPNIGDSTMIAKCGKWGLVNFRGEVIVPFEYDYLGSFHNGIALIEVGNKRGAINDKNEVVIPAKYDSLNRCDNGIYTASIFGKYGFINQNDEIVIPFEYDEVDPFSEGLASVRMGNKWGYINEKNEMVIACQFDYAGLFRDGVVNVGKDDDYFHIDKNGNPAEDNMPF